ncbi:hypothetical protein SAMN05661096_03720 [Marivirga sericea]|uniref:Uncharacterized protein n=1 Tax=Marivirga sericea TaxID=1028 RepID=A0A1X7LBC1_9BACT|nr:hypothetical protein [Marivirga sericea]SMG50703.1 hypothetical protein SAMN05661096_03720 [Marivirga sericea]
MKLEKVLDQLNSFEKNSFLKIIDAIISENPVNRKDIDKILSESDRELKNIDNINIAKVFKLIEVEFQKYVEFEFKDTTSQLDVLIDIIIRDGNCIMKSDWLARLYENEIKSLKSKIKNLRSTIDKENNILDNYRERDYHIYKACLETAYNNDKGNNLDQKVTQDELSILLTLASKLELSQEEVRLINYMVLPVEKQNIDDIINELKNIGVIFFSKKTNTVYVADEIIRNLRKVRKKDVADKYFRRVLRSLKDPQINLACRKHNIDWQNVSFDQKIKKIIKEGIPFTALLTTDIYKNGTKLSDKKAFLNDLFENGLNTNKSLKGSTIEEKVDNIIQYFDEIERDERVGISLEGYDQLLNDLNSTLPKSNDLLKNEFELQDNNVLSSEYLLDFNIKPRDVLEVIDSKELKRFCDKLDIKTRGNTILNILESYKDAENLSLENYEHFAYRDVNKIKENGLNVKEADLGIQFEDLTKKIFEELKFNVDEQLRKDMNTNKDKIDILLNLGNNQLILVECKTSKEKGFNKFSTVSRQLKSYVKLAEKNGYNIIKSLLIAPEFSDDFVSECNLEYELNLSLIKARSLYNILDAFKDSKKHKEFPHNLLMKDVVIQEDRIVKALAK